VLAHLAVAIHPRFKPAPEEETEHLGDLVRQINSLLEMRRKQIYLLRNSIHKDNINKLIDSTDVIIESVGNELRAALLASSSWKVGDDLLSELCGVGEVFADIVATP